MSTFENWVLAHLQFNTLEKEEFKKLFFSDNPFPNLKSVEDLFDLYEKEIKDILLKEVNIFNHMPHVKQLIKKGLNKLLQCPTLENKRDFVYQAYKQIIKKNNPRISSDLIKWFRAEIEEEEIEDILMFGGDIALMSDQKMIDFYNQYETSFRTVLLLKAPERTIDELISILIVQACIKEIAFFIQEKQTY